IAQGEQVQGMMGSQMAGKRNSLQGLDLDEETARTDGNEFLGVEKFAGVVRLDEGRLRSHVDGVVRGDGGQGADSYRESIRILEGLLQDYPDSVTYKRRLMSNMHQLGVVLRGQGGRKESEASFSVAEVIAEELANRRLRGTCRLRRSFPAAAA